MVGDVELLLRDLAPQRSQVSRDDKEQAETSSSGLLHGEGPWSAAARVVSLFERSNPGQCRLVSWGNGAGEGQSRSDLVAFVLGSARNPSAEDKVAQLSALRFAVGARGCGPGRVHG